MTRDEYNRFLKSKEKLLTCDVATQTLSTPETNQDKSTDTPSADSSSDSDTSSHSRSTSRSTSSKSSSDASESDDESIEVEIRRSNKRDRDDDISKAEGRVIARAKKLFKQFKKQRYVNHEDEEYFSKLDKVERERIRDMEDKLYNTESGKVPLRFKIIQSNIDDKLKALCLKKIDQLDSMQSYSDEYFKLLQWVESVARLPINKYKRLPITSSDNVGVISSFLSDTRTKLDDNVYGHKDTKEQIVRLLAKWISNKDAKGLIIGLEGPMGTGKTSLCLEICKALGLPSGFISLGGMSSSEYLLGHSYTYEGSRWGKVAEVLMHAEYTNPVMFFDELDKVSTSRHGEEIINTLIHITDVTQNHDFRDKYFSEVPLDLSKCIIIFSYNNGEFINPILRDRMVTIKASGYKQTDKVQICNKHMIPKILSEYAFQANDIVFSDSVLQYIISITDEEDGVRKLKRSLEEIVSQVNVIRLLKNKLTPTDETEVTFPLRITEDIARRFVPKQKKENFKHSSMYI